MTLDRDELVVAEHHRHHPTGSRVVDEVLGPVVRERATQHEADLVGEPGPGDLRGHRLGCRRCSTANGFSQKIGEPSLDGLGHLARVLARPRADVDGVAPVEHLVLGVAHVWPAAAANASARARSGSYTPARTTPCAASAPLRRRLLEW